VSGRSKISWQISHKAGPILVKFLVPLIIVVGLSVCRCTRNFEPLNPSEDQNLPNWLSNLIAEKQNDQFYWGTTVFRHLWHNQYYYLPCMYYEVYDYTGKKSGLA
jgi:hypothetical protein